MRRFSSSVFIIILFLWTDAFCQSDDIKLLEFEKSIDKAIIDTNIPFLQKAYADDFRFKHSNGHIDTKASWIESVEKNKGVYLSRAADSVEVEIHHNVGITNGKMTIKRTTEMHIIKYVRVYVRKNGSWKMIMHRTVQELPH